MIVYNTLKTPVSVTVGTKTAVIERESEWNERIPSGEHSLSAYIAKEDGSPAPQTNVSTGPRSGYSCVNLAVAATVNVRRDTKVYLRQVHRSLPENYKQHLGKFDLLIENGDLSELRHGYADEHTRQKVVKSAKTVFLFGAIVALMMFGVMVAIWIRFGMDAVAVSLTKVEVLMLVVMTAIPATLMSVMIWWCIKPYRLIAKFKNIPILTETNYYDDL